MGNIRRPNGLRLVGEIPPAHIAAELEPKPAEGETFYPERRAYRRPRYRPARPSKLAVAAEVAIWFIVGAFLAYVWLA